MKLTNMNPHFAAVLLSLAGLTLNAETVLVDFGNDLSWRGISVANPDDNGNYWTSIKPGQAATNLVDHANVETAIDVIAGPHDTDSYNGPAGATDGGITETMLLTLNIDRQALGNLGVPEAAIDFHAGLLGDPKGRFQVEGLNPAGKYTFSFFCSHKYNASDYVRINICDDSDRLNVIGTQDILMGSGSSHNTDTLAVFADLTPSGDGILYFEFGGADGTSKGYINSMQISTESGGVDPDPDPDPEPDLGIKLVVAGSSVPAGFAASLAGTYRHDYDQENDTGKDYWDYEYGIYGYAGRLRLALTDPVKPKVPGGSTTGWEFVNVSVPGDNTILVRNRFEEDVTRQYPEPKVSHSEPAYVILALSLANEGLVYTSTPQAVFDSFRDGMLDLIQRCDNHGYYPIITLVYPHADYTPEKYEFVKQMNLLMNSWGVTSINLLGAIDKGNGQWADGFVYDPGHPNFLGHEEMFLSIPPTLFDAIHFDGKRAVPTYPVEADFVELANHGGVADTISFTPQGTMRAFTTSFKLRTDATGTIAAVRAKYRPLLLVDFGPANDDDGRATASPDAFGSHWNNWRPTEGGVTIPSGTTLENLVTREGDATTIGLEVTTPIGGSNGILNGGLFGSAGPNSDLLGHFAIETATEDYFYTTTTSAFKITGLDPDKRYTLRFFGTRNTDAVRETRYRVTGTTANISFSPYVDIVTSGPGISNDGTVDGNDSAIGLVSGIQPRINGEIIVEILPEAGGYAYIGAMELSVDDAVDRYASLEVRSGELVYIAADGRELAASVDVSDDTWHDISLAHRYAQQQTLLFVDGVQVGTLRENLEPDYFVVGGPGISGMVPAPTAADFQDWAVYRAAWNADEAMAQHQGNLQNASLDLLAPLSDDTFTDGVAVANLAQTRSEAIIHLTPSASGSFWSGVPADPVSGAKYTGIGWIDDYFWPYIYRFEGVGWMYVLEPYSWGKDSFYSYAFDLSAWLWASDAYGGWYYNYQLGQWLNFDS